MIVQERNEQGNETMTNEIMTFAERLAAYATDPNTKIDPDKVPSGLTTADKLPKFPYAWGMTRNWGAES